MSTSCSPCSFKVWRKNEGGLYKKFVVVVLCSVLIFALWPLGPSSSKLRTCHQIHRWSDPVGSLLFALCPAWLHHSLLPCPRPCLRRGSAVVLERRALIRGVQQPLCHPALLMCLWDTRFQLMKPW